MESIFIKKSEVVYKVLEGGVINEENQNPMVLVEDINGYKHVLSYELYDTFEQVTESDFENYRFLCRYYSDKIKDMEVACYDED